MVVAPASHIALHNVPTSITFLCFEKHILDTFDKMEVVSIILHRMGHVFNLNLTGDNHEFKADDYALERGLGKYIISSLERGIRENFPGFSEPINKRRLDRLQILTQ